MPGEDRGRCAVSAIAAALEGGAKPQWLEVASHEVGHGLIWHVTGFPVRQLRGEGGWCGGVSGGFAHLVLPIEFDKVIDDYVGCSPVRQHRSGT